MSPGPAGGILRRTPYHVGVATRSLPAALELLGEAFGLEWSEPYALEPLSFWTPDGPTTVRGVSVHSRTGPLHVEVIEGAPGTTWETDRAAQLHHHGYWSRDVAADADGLGRLGWSVEMCLVDGEGRPTSFAYLTKPDSFRVELVDVARHRDYCRRVGAEVPVEV